MNVGLSELNASTEREAPFTVYNDNYGMQLDANGDDLELHMHEQVQVGTTSYEQNGAAVTVGGQNLFQVKVEAFASDGSSLGVIDAFDHVGNEILAKSVSMADGSSGYQIYDYFAPDLYFTNKTANTEATFVVEIEGVGSATQDEINAILADVVYDDAANAYVEILIA